MVVDTTGLIWSCVVCSAGVQDNDAPAAGEALLRLARQQWVPRLALIWCDSAYRGMMNCWAQLLGPWRVERVERPAGTVGFTKLPKRWVVERTFAWLHRFRRLRVRDERRADLHQAFLDLGCALICWKLLD